MRLKWELDCPLVPRFPPPQVMVRVERHSQSDAEPKASEIGTREHMGMRAEVARRLSRRPTLSQPRGRRVD